MPDVAKASRFVKLFRCLHNKIVCEAPLEVSVKYFSDEEEANKSFAEDEDLHSMHSSTLSPEADDAEAQGFSLEEFDAMYTVLSGNDQLNLGQH